MSEEPGARILVVDDEPAIRRALRANLARHGFQVDTIDTAQGALDHVERRHPDLLLLDLGLPDSDGLDVIRAIRSKSALPIVVLSVRGAEREKVAALDLGADDYLTKPFGADELLARIRVALRHAARPSSGAAAIFRTGGLEVDFELRRVMVDGREVHLTPIEFGLLKAFVAHPNKLLTPGMLLHQVWGLEYGVQAHYLHVYIARLRKKIEADPREPHYIRSEPGVGYRLIAEDL